MHKNRKKREIIKKKQDIEADLNEDSIVAINMPLFPPYPPFSKFLSLPLSLSLSLSLSHSLSLSLSLSLSDCHFCKDKQNKLGWKRIC